MHRVTRKAILGRQSNDAIIFQPTQAALGRNPDGPVSASAEISDATGSETARCGV